LPVDRYAALVGGSVGAVAYVQLGGDRPSELLAVPMNTFTNVAGGLADADVDAESDASAD